MMRIERLSQTGLGLAEDGSRWPRVLPGEEIDAEGKIVTPSADRIKAPCRHFRSCGGCSLQHASDQFVADWKVDQVRRALAARGLTPEFSQIETSPPSSRRRAKLSGRRTKSGAIVGFHGRASDMVVSVPECTVLHPRIIALVPTLERITERVASRKGEISLTVTDTDAGSDVVVEGGSAELNLEMTRDLTELAEAGGLARLTWNGEVILTRVDPAVGMGPAQVVPPPGAFLQATVHGQQALTAGVLDGIGAARRVVDLFAGCGTFALPVAEQAEVHAVEGSAEMLTALDRAWRLTPGLRRVTTEARDLFRRPLLDDELRYDAAIVDPPRSGAEAQIAQIAGSGLPVVVMVSCNPVTFARDASVLAQAGFEMGQIRVIDQFRWAAHIELVCVFTRA